MQYFKRHVFSFIMVGILSLLAIWLFSIVLSLGLIAKIIISIFSILLIEWYVFQGFRSLVKKKYPKRLKLYYWGYWLVFFSLLIGLLVHDYLENYDLKYLTTLIKAGFFINLPCKVFAAIVLFVDDLRIGFQKISSRLQPKAKQPQQGERISRSIFLTKVAAVAGTIPLITLGYGIHSGAYDYHIRRKTIYFKKLPKALDGLKVGQISDIHSGSFFDKIAVQGGVDMLMNEKPDIIFFTGDLVNDESAEIKEYFSIFKQVKADLGVFSVMGNHDYGTYRHWDNPALQQADVKKLHQIQRAMGWNLLLNQKGIVKVGGEELPIIGVENWGKGRFPRYGDLQQAARGLDKEQFKILLSHDPSHWDAQVRPHHPDIDLTLSGHTHGFQFGVEIGDIKWSPSQYIYDQWAGLYQKDDQFLYVNRGFGFIGYPGRVGILPEITILELKAVV